MKNRKDVSLTLLRLSAVIYGLITLAEAGAAVSFAVRLNLFQEWGSGAGVGFTIIGKPDALDILVPVLLVLPPVLTAVALILLHRRKKRNAELNGRKLNGR